jgi:enoyl-[acyl-carrier protein] reductase III
MAVMADRFAGKVALVTGGSKGIGRAIGKRLAREGASIAFTWFRDRAAAEKTLAELDELGARAHAIQAFLGEPDVPGGVVDEVGTVLGEPTILVSNAATGVQRPLTQITKRHWDWTMETNASAFLRFVQHAPKLEGVLALTSAGSARVLRNYGIVGISKSALETAVRYLAVELAPDCRVNAISAGVVDTDSIRRFPTADDLLRDAKERTPSGRLVEPEDVASLAAFLLSDEAAMITGQTVTVDGGLSILA